MNINRKRLIIIITILILFLSILLLIFYKMNNQSNDSINNITFENMDFDNVNKIYIKSLYRGYDDYIYDEEKILTIIDFL